MQIFVNTNYDFMKWRYRVMFASVFQWSSIQRRAW